MPPEVSTGSIVGGFREESLIGRGAMATVYLAHEEGGGRRVALKLLSSELA
jgi:serine/threonine protein kinase